MKYKAKEKNWSCSLYIFINKFDYEEEEERFAADTILYEF